MHIDDAVRPNATPWEEQAANWIAWARTPGHDVFEYFAPAFFDEIASASRGLALEVGCGEGRVMRALSARGHRAIGLDASRALARSARGADATGGYVVGDAAQLPFADGTFDLVVAYNSLQTMRRFDDMARAVSEAARVLRDGGSFCACVAHPMTDLALITAGDGGEPDYSASYFEPRQVADTVTREGLSMTFHGWTYTLEDYARAFEDAGLLIDRMREPRPPQQDVEARPSLARWRDTPLFLFMRGVKH